MAFTLIIIALLLFVLSACAKLAARILSYSGVNWRVGFIYAATVLLLSFVIKVILSSLSIHLAGYSAIPIALLLQAAVGAWFFRTRATSKSGVAVGTAGGAKLSAVIFGMWALASLTLFALSGLITHH